MVHYDLIRAGDEVLCGKDCIAPEFLGLAKIIDARAAGRVGYRAREPCINQKQGSRMIFILFELVGGRFG